MRALLIGAVEGTRIALNAIVACPDWTLAGVATLPAALASRHSDFVDLASSAEAVGAEVIPVANGNDPDFIARAKALAPDMVFVIGWSQLCGPAFRAAMDDRVIGYHPAALPRLRGRAAIPWTILLDEKITASTLFWIDEAVDSGAILAQRFFHVAPDETAATLYEKHMIALRRILDEILPRLARGERPAERQDDRLATWAARRRPEDGRIDWSRSADEVARLIRAVGRPYPGAVTTMGDAEIAIWGAEHWPGGERHHAMPGQVIARDATGFSVRCGDGRAVRITDFGTATGRMPALHARLGG